MPTTKQAKRTGAIELLKADHEEVRGLLKKLAETSERAAKTRRQLLERVSRELQAHTTIEEEIFYPAVREAAERKEHVKMVAEAIEEHRTVDELVLPDLERTDVESIEFGGRAKVLKELVEHHADEEEERMFPAAKQLFSKEELHELGARMEERKKQLLR